MQFPEIWKKIDNKKLNFTDLKLVRERSCPICGVADATEIMNMYDFQFFSDSLLVPKLVDIHNVQCNVCKALYMNPVYSDYGFKVLFAEMGCSYGAFEFRAGEQINWLINRDLLKPNTIFLDIGCYEGKFLSLLPNYIKGIGVDIDRLAIERGNKKYKKLNLICSDFNTFLLPESPNIISMFHVLEHLTDPVDTLMHLRTLSTPETRLVVEVPILQNGLTNDVCGFMGVQHTTHFSKISLINAFNKSGWCIEESYMLDSYNGFRVLAKPSALQELLPINQEDKEQLSSYLKHRENSVFKINNIIEELKQVQNIVIWGGGLHTEFLFQMTSLFKGKDNFFIIIDSDPIKQGTTYRGINITGPSILKKINWKTTKMLVSSYGTQYSIIKSALNLLVPKNRIVSLYNYLEIY
jgi:SAM-dependent methyltransferase